METYFDFHFDRFHPQPGRATTRYPAQHRLGVDRNHGGNDVSYRPAGRAAFREQGIKTIGIRRGARAFAIGLILIFGAQPSVGFAKTDSSIEVTDARIENSIETAFLLSEPLSFYDLDVKVNNGIVTLKGDVDSKIDAKLATDIAQSAANVRGVENELKIQPGSRKAPTGIESESARFMQRVKDANVTAKVKSQLLWNSKTEGLNIDVDTDKGLVTLSGDVASVEEAKMAKKLAADTEGVRKVKNNLKVVSERTDAVSSSKKATETASAEVKDGWVTTRVKAALLYDNRVDGTDIHVETAQGIVTLTGSVNNKNERDIAKQITHSIGGVKSVVDRIDVAQAAADD